MSENPYSPYGVGSWERAMETAIRDQNERAEATLKDSIAVTEKSRQAIFGSVEPSVAGRHHGLIGPASQPETPQPQREHSVPPPTFWSALLNAQLHNYLTAPISAGIQRVFATRAWKSIVWIMAFSGAWLGYTTFATTLGIHPLIAAAGSALLGFTLPYLAGAIVVLAAWLIGLVLGWGFWIAIFAGGAFLAFKFVESLAAGT